VVQLFSERVAAGDRDAFNAGVAALQSRDFPGAETNFKKAIQIENDSTAALAYLAASFAASGHDEPAASAWQTALIEGSDLPQIYVWLGDALLRSRSFSSAKAILEEAVGKWPGDARFAKPLALMYATFGQGREALRTLVRHVDSAPDDVDAMYLTVEWTYHLHAAGILARTRSEDLALARTAAERYERAKGPQLALVKQWMSFLENPSR
jgi:Tfp pilus assembly protein PilF